MRIGAFSYLGIAFTTAFIAVTAYEDEEMRAHAADVTKRIAQVHRDAPQSLVPTNELPRVLTGRAEVIDGRTLRYVVSGLTVELAGIDVCAAEQTAMFEGTPWPCGLMATAWLVSQTLGRDLQCQRFDRRFDGTIVARCAIDGADLAGEAVLSGHAVVNTSTRAGVPFATYRELEERARAARTGLWSSEFAMPASFRRERFEENASRIWRGAPSPAHTSGESSREFVR